MTKLAICQNGYPKKVIINGDTVIAITVQQMQIMNHIHISLEECRVVDSITTGALDSCYVLTSLQNKIIEEYKDQVVIYQDAVLEKDAVISKAVITDRNQKKEIKQLNRYNNILKGGTIIAITLAIIVIIL